MEHHVTHMLARQNSTRLVMNPHVNSHLSLSGCGRTAGKAEPCKDHSLRPAWDDAEREWRCKKDKGTSWQTKKVLLELLLLFFFKLISLHNSQHLPPHMHTWHEAYTKCDVNKQRCYRFLFDLILSRSGRINIFLWIVHRCRQAVGSF